MTRIAAALAQLPRAVTVEAAATIIHEIRQQLRKEFADEIDKLKSDFDLRLSALMQATEKLERGIGGDRGEVVELPALPRSVRRA